MSARFLDLAAKPFANVRPIRRLAAVLWIAGAVLTVANTTLYLRSFEGLESTHAALNAVIGEIDALEAEVARTTTDLRALDLGEQNERVRFLNLRIAERTFAWGRLFDRLGEVLPDQVRLTTLSPQVLGETNTEGARSRRRAQTGTSTNRVFLRLLGTAEGEGPLLDFIDQLYADPAFANPSLANESRDLGVLRKFTLTVTYLPEAAAASEPLESDEGDGVTAAVVGGRIAARDRADGDASALEAGDSTAEGSLAGTTPPRIVVDRTGEGRYFGPTDPRAAGTSRRQRAMQRPSAAAERSAAEGQSGAQVLGGLQYLGGTAGHQSGAVEPGQRRGAAPVPLGPSASDTRRPQ